MHKPKNIVWEKMAVVTLAFLLCAVTVKAVEGKGTCNPKPCVGTTGKAQPLPLDFLGLQEQEKRTSKNHPEVEERVGEPDVFRKFHKTMPAVWRIAWSLPFHNEHSKPVAKEKE
jgi:hypothetical protein